VAGLLVAGFVPLATGQTAWAQGAPSQLTLAKQSHAKQPVHVGDRIPYEYVVTDNGPTPVTGVYVADDHNRVQCPKSTLRAGESMTCTGTYTVVQADHDHHAVVNTAIAHARSGGVDIDSPPATTVVPVVDGEEFGFIFVHKTDATNGQPLAGATYQLWQETNGIPGLQTGGANPDTPVGEPCTTSTVGECLFDGLPFGDYYLQETGTPVGFEPPANPVTGPYTVNSLDGVQVAIANTPVVPPTGQVTVVKTDKKNGKLLAGGVFQLWQETNNIPGLQTSGANRDQFVDECTTNSQGTCGFQNLAFGTYYLREITVPDGYRRPANPVTGPFTLTSTVSAVTANVTNSRIPVCKCKVQKPHKHHHKGKHHHSGTY